MSPKLTARTCARCHKGTGVITSYHIQDAAGAVVRISAHLKCINAMRLAIERNKRQGLLCACNQVRVPYDPPRERRVDGVLHGYDDCEVGPCTR